MTSVVSMRIERQPHEQGPQTELFVDGVQQERILGVVPTGREHLQHGEELGIVEGEAPVELDILCHGSGSLAENVIKEGEGEFDPIRRVEEARQAFHQDGQRAEGRQGRAQRVQTQVRLDHQGERTHRHLPLDS